MARRRILQAAPVVLAASLLNAAVLTAQADGAADVERRIERPQQRELRVSPELRIDPSIATPEEQSQGQQGPLGQLLDQLASDDVALRRAAALEVGDQMQTATGILPEVLLRLRTETDDQVQVTLLSAIAALEHLAVSAVPELEALGRQRRSPAVLQEVVNALHAVRDPGLHALRDLRRVNPRIRNLEPTEPAIRFVRPELAIREDLVPPPVQIDHDPDDYLFAKTIGPVFSHPRCINCHTFRRPGGVWERTHLPQAGNPGPSKDWNRRFPDVDCQGCHTYERTGMDRWRAPYSVVDEDWDERSTIEICEAITRRFGPRPSVARRHLLEDQGIIWAIANRRTPNLVVQPGPLDSWAEWEHLVELWITKGFMRCEPPPPEPDPPEEPEQPSLRDLRQTPPVTRPDERPEDRRFPGLPRPPTGIE